MKEDDKLLKKVGKENPFTVPEGYFEQFTPALMSNLPEKKESPFVMKKPTLWDKVKPWAYMAAMFIGAAFIIRVASHEPDAAEDQLVAVSATEQEPEAAYEEYIDFAVSQAMLDDYSLYMYVAEAAVD